MLTYAWVAFQEGSKCLGVFLLAGCGILTLICLVLLRRAKDDLEHLNFEIISVEAADRENIAFLLLYLLPLFTAEFATLNWKIWLPAMAIFAAVVATGYAYHFNPLLGLMGWHFYKVGTTEGITYILITKKQLRRAAETVEVGQLTEYMVIDLGNR